MSKLKPSVKVTPVSSPTSIESSTILVRKNTKDKKEMGSRGSIASSESDNSTTTYNITEMDANIRRKIGQKDIFKIMFQTCQKAGTEDRLGKGRQVLKIMLLLMLPIMALAGVTIRNLVDSSNESAIKAQVREAMNFAMETGSLIDNLQKERDRVALFLTSKSSETRILIDEIFRQTDASLNTLTNWRVDETEASQIEFVNLNAFKEHLRNRRRQISNHPDNTRPMEEVKYYTNEVIRIFINWVTDTIQRSRDGALWKTMMSYLLVLMSKENTGVERTLGGVFFVQGGFKDDDDYMWYIKSHFQGIANFKDASEYSEAIKVIQAESDEEIHLIMNNIDGMRKDILAKKEFKGFGSLELSTLWLNNLSMYMEHQQNIMERLGKYALNTITTDRLDDYNSLMLNLGFFLISLLSSPVVIFIVYTMMDDIATYSKVLMTQACVMSKDRHRADKLLYGLLPKAIITKLRNRQNVQAETYTDTSIMVGRLANFSSIVGNSQPLQVITVLNCTYKILDDRVDQFDVHKMHDSDDWFMIVSGVPKRNAKRHATETARLALDIRHHLLHVQIAHMPGVKLQFQAGISSGPVVAALVGLTVPRYCLFGISVTKASVIEANTEPGKILISEVTRNLLLFDPSYEIVTRGQLNVMDQENISAHWLIKKRGYEEALPCMPNCQGENGEG